MVALRSKALLQTKKLLTHNRGICVALVARQTTKLLPGVPAASGLPVAEGIIAQNSRQETTKCTNRSPTKERRLLKISFVI